MIKGLIFDLDGVIISTVKYHYLAWKKIAELLNFKFDENDNELLRGVSRTRSFEIILELNNKKMSEKDIEKYCELKNNYYKEYLNNLTEADLLPGAKAFLIECHKKELKIALGSASKNSRFILEKTKILDLFDVVVDGTMVSNAKPNPEVFLKGAELLKLSSKECIVFEDALAGIIAAHNGGMKAIGVGNEEVEKYSDLFINSFLNIDINVILKKLK